MLYNGKINEFKGSHLISKNYTDAILDESLVNNDDDLIIPDNLNNLTYSVTDSSVLFDYDLPTENFSHLEIYRDNELIIENYQLDTFEDKKLEPNTTYEYMFKSVSVEGKKSKGKIVEVKTNIENDTIPPEIPKNLSIDIGNGNLKMNWSANTEDDLQGYNIYLNGNLYNSSIIKDTYFSIPNLENGKSYNVQVSAVDTSGNESEKSSVVSGSPDKNEIPVFTMDYTLKDVALSVENWFSSLWLVLAFAVAIPLSFYIANRIKSLFLA